MLLFPAEALPEGSEWTYELKLDGYRALAIKTDGQVRLRSPQRQGLQPEVPVDRESPRRPARRDGHRREVVALDPDGRPSFNTLQNGSAGATIVYYVFDVMVMSGRSRRSS
jgi:ATP-dependent DNA ligase